jgi:hypothetical protein
MNHCEENDSTWGALVATALSLVTFAGIPPDELLRLELSDVGDDFVATLLNRKALLTNDAARFLRRWLNRRGHAPGLLLTIGEESPPLSLRTLTAVLAKQCQRAGVRPFSMEDLSRTQAWIGCGEWAYPCGCDLQASAEPLFRESLPSDIPRVRYLRRMESAKRCVVTKSLNEFCRTLNAGTTLASLDWHQVTPSSYARTISSLHATYSWQRVRAMRRYVNAVMHAERRYGSLGESHYRDLRSVSWKGTGNQSLPNHRQI